MQRRLFGEGIRPFWCRHWKSAAVLPHPYPLPRGEGERLPAAVGKRALLGSTSGQSGSLSQRERAGVRENGSNLWQLVRRKLRCAPVTAALNFFRFPQPASCGHRPRNPTPPHVRHHLASGRGQDDADGEAAALRRRGAARRLRDRAQKPARHDERLDGAGEEARHLDQLDGAAI